jgi:hypothetical protein
MSLADIREPVSGRDDASLIVNLHSFMNVTITNGQFSGMSLSALFS